MPSRDLLERCKRAAETVVALLFFLGVHKVLDYAAVKAFHEFGTALTMLRAVFFVAFGTVYVHTALEMVVAFIPSARTAMEHVGQLIGERLRRRLGAGNQPNPQSPSSPS
jgi:hypothetical protein